MAKQPKVVTAEVIEAIEQRSNGHAPADAPGDGLLNPLLDLVHVLLDVEQKDELCTQLGQRIEPLKRLKVRVSSGDSTLMAVEADIELLQRLTQELTQARLFLQEAREAATAAALIDQIHQIKAIFDDGKWTAAVSVLARLEEKGQKQEEIVRDYRTDLSRHSETVRRLRAVVDRANKAHAPVRTQVKQLERFDALLMAAERALRGEQPINDLLNGLKTLQDETQTIEGDLVKIEGDIFHTEQFSRQADLLLLQSPIDLHGRYHYAVLLRTPSEPGAHGINVQGSTTLVEQDRTLMGDAIQRITQAVDRGLVRLAEVGVAPTDAATAISLTVSPVAPATRSVTRRYVFGTETVDESTPLDVSSLVREMGDLMYRLFMPEQMQQYLRDTRCALTITTNDLELPWEFMYYAPKEEESTLPGAVTAASSTVKPTTQEGERIKDEKSFLCLNRPVARMPMGRALPMFEAPRIRRAPKRQFLLIADPTGDLPGARHEINLLQAWLTREWAEQIEIEVLEGAAATGRMLNQALRSDRYDVIHYSGHAFFDQNDPDLSGLLLHNREIYFAQKIRRLLEGRPLVFLNACQSGLAANEAQEAKADRSFNLQKPAEGLASSFIYGGALGCIGSLWPIYDEPSARFAIQFYQYVLEGHMIGEAMRLARIEIKKKDPITWAAFVLYGDPTFRLVE